MFLLLNVHGGEKAYQGRGRVGKGGRKCETSKQAPTRKTKAAVDRRQNNSVRPTLRSDHRTMQLLFQLLCSLTEPWVGGDDVELHVLGCQLTH